MLIVETFKKLSDQFCLRKSTDIKMLLRTENGIPGFTIPKTLKEIYKISNGFSLLDYCFIGARGSKPDIETITFGLWNTNDCLNLDFVSLITTSYNLNVGFLKKIKNKSNEHYIAFNDDILEDSLVVISSSIELFLYRFFNLIKEFTPFKKNEFCINDDLWLYDMTWWLDNDPELVEAYRSGKLVYYYKNNKNFIEFIDNYLDSHK